MVLAETVHFIVGNTYEGCGHKHKTPMTARKCLTRLKANGAPLSYKVYRITATHVSKSLTDTRWEVVTGDQQR